MQSAHVLEAVHIEIQGCYDGKKGEVLCVPNVLHDIKSMCILMRV
jgi:hypothetical protein